MANKRKVTQSKPKHSKAAPTPVIVVPVIPPVRRPALIRTGTFTVRWLKPNHGLHGPVETWTKETSEGWTGWLQTMRATQIKMTTWSKLVWTETTAPEIVQVKPGVVKAQPKVEPAPVRKARAR